MKHIKKIFIYSLFASCVLSIAACGKMSDPKPISGSGYPHTYPRY